MATVVADMSVSLDGFVAEADGGVERVFAWYAKPQPESQPRQGRSEPGASGLRVIVAGRRTFEQAEGWGGKHPTGAPVIVVTHGIPEGWLREGAAVSFVTEGIETAMKQAAAIADDGVIALATPSVIQQCLTSDSWTAFRSRWSRCCWEPCVPMFGKLTGDPIELENPTVVEGNGVTHLHYRVPDQRRAA